MTSDSRTVRRAAGLCVASALATIALLHAEGANAYSENVEHYACHGLNPSFLSLVCPLQDNATYRFDEATRVRAYVRNDATNGVVVAACVSAAQEFGTHCGAPKGSSTIGWTIIEPSRSEWLSGVDGFPYLKVDMTAGWYSGFAASW